ncbi:MAG: 2-amino-4-hydroxy-6-hydroxymethyldihydropteridine diphosphokinase [Sphingobacteriales bacterium]|nr:2-amino-4-hydroxy-6-hydroxymethyldihydropteridine diphosphokinase [Sphingobacteriales bacterium]
MKMKNRAILSLGSNLGDRLMNLHTAMKLLTADTGELTINSSVYETEPWGLKEQPDFLNMVVGIETELSPQQLLSEIKYIEDELLREKSIRWGSRSIDIDILFFNDLVINSDILTIPHPEIANRRFVLVPLAEIFPDLIHPVLKKPVNSLLVNCSDPSEVKLFEQQKIIV